MIIETKNLTKIYHVGVERIAALNGVSLNVEPNEYLAIMGSSGSGKSTLMNILGCLDKPTKGTYKIRNHDIRKLNATELARIRNEEIGFVFQSFELLSRMSALRNVEMPLLYSQGNWSSRRRKARAALERVGLGDRVRHRPNQLSGGQKQRVAIARAILNNPSILFADEPTGNLDSSTTHEIMDLFGQLHDEGQTIILVTHENDVAANCQRVVRLTDGCISSDLPVLDDPEVHDHQAALLKAGVTPFGGAASPASSPASESAAEAKSC